MLCGREATSVHARRESRQALEVQQNSRSSTKRCIHRALCSAYYVKGATLRCIASLVVQQGFAAAYKGLNKRQMTADMLNVKSQSLSSLLSS